MLSFALRLGRFPTSPSPRGVFARHWRWLGVTGAVLVLAAGTMAAASANGDFGKDIQLAPFVVNGAPLSISILARTKADRHYAEKFADEVVGVAYETMGGSTGKGLIIVGANGEPHPIRFFRKFMAMAQAGQLDPSLADSVAELDGRMKKLQEIIRISDDPGRPSGITFETFLPALPLPLVGVASRLYQLAWAEGFDDARVEKKLKSLTRADLARDDLVRYDWVFYLPPHSATPGVLDEMLTKAMAAQKMGIFKRAVVRTAAFTFRPLINKAVEGMRKGMLFSAILHAESKYDDGDIEALTKVYVAELMPDVIGVSKPAHQGVLVAIEKQKKENAEYAKDPFVKPARLTAFDPAAYSRFEGEFTSKPPQTTHWFKRVGDTFQWNYKDHKPRVFYPAGERLLVNEDGTMTIRFLVDDAGTVTGAEERWVRRRQIIPRQTLPAVRGQP